MAGSTGVLVPPVGYLEKLREITAKHGILLIFDEVITAYGRLGEATAAHYFGVTPDLITMAKGVSNAAIPAGAVAVKREVHDAIVNGPQGGIEFFHGYTYSAHPLAAAAILATLDIYRRDDLFGRARKLSGAFQEAAHSLRARRTSSTCATSAWWPASNWPRAPALPARALRKCSRSASTAASWSATPAISSPSRRPDHRRGPDRPDLRPDRQGPERGRVRRLRALLSRPEPRAA